MKNIKIYKIVPLMRYVYLSFLFVSLLISSSCRKMLKIDPPIDFEIGSEIYSSNAGAAAVLTGIFLRISETGAPFSGNGGMSMGLGLSADELTLTENVPNGILYLPLLYKNSLSSNYTAYWTRLFDIIYRCNGAITGIENSTSLSPDIKKHLLGEAKFMRAFCYYYVINLFGEAPILTSTDYKVNSTLPRNSISELISFILKDLNDAETDLPENYVSSNITTTSQDRVRPNKMAASAMLARMYLLLKDYTMAGEKASVSIDLKSQYDTVSLKEVFLANSKEAIWQLQPVTFGENTKDGLSFVLPLGGPNLFSKPAYLSNVLATSFDLEDNRSTYWIDSVIANGTIYKFPFKYKVGFLNQPVSEYLMMLRVGEQYLIRAEARAMNNNLPGALEDLNVIRRRAGLGDFYTNDQNALIKQVLEERRHELFCEMGQRWFDLKRTNTIDSVMNQLSTVKGIEWQPYKQFFPIPNVDIVLNPALAPNNPGY